MTGRVSAKINPNRKEIIMSDQEKKFGDGPWAVDDKGYIVDRHGNSIAWMLTKAKRDMLTDARKHVETPERIAQLEGEIDVCEKAAPMLAAGVDALRLLIHASFLFGTVCEGVPPPEVAKWLDEAQIVGDKAVGRG